MTTNRQHRTVALVIGLLIAVVITVIGLAAQADASSSSTAPTASAPSVGSLTQAETRSSPSVVLIEYAISASAQNIKTGQVFTSFTDNGPISTSFIGTGFFASSDGFIVTAAHLAAPTVEDQKQSILTELYTEAIATNNCAGCDPDPAQDAADAAANYQLTGVRTQITVFTQDLDLANHPSGLTAALIQSSPVTENDTAVIKVQGSNFPVLPMGDSDAAQVGDAVGVIGYPSTAIDNVDLSALTSPTVTSGSVTNKPSQGGFARIQSDATAEHGNSGGPMINSAGQVIGIVSNGPTSTTNFFIPSNAVKLVLRQAGVDNSSGQIDSLWRDGLAAYAGHKYRQADQLFAQCVALNKVQVGCASYDKLAIGNFGLDAAPTTALSTVPLLDHGRGGSSGLGSAVIVIGLLLVAVAAVGVALLVRRGRRGGGGPSAPANPATPAGGPLYPPVPQYGTYPGTYAGPGSSEPPQRPVPSAPTTVNQVWN
jgi:S1-C subfamily serine protease